MEENERERGREGGQYGRKRERVGGREGGQHGRKRERGGREKKDNRTNHYEIMSETEKDSSQMAVSL